MKIKYFFIFLFVILLLVLNIFLQKLYKNALVEKSEQNNSQESISNEEDQIQSTSTPVPKLTKIILGGDVMLGRNVMITTKKEGDYNYPFSKVSQYLNTADLVFVNLENPVVKDCPEIDSGFKFCSIPEMLEGLTKSNIKLVNVANNHIYNYGDEGFEETLKHLDDKNIEYVGKDNVITKRINGTNFSFLGFDLVSNELSVQNLDLVKKAKDTSDVVVVGVHWGEEYEALPNESQKIWAKKIIEYGADVIVGHHPHWVQTVEEINGKKVYYSLGNFVFDQMWSEETKKGILIELVFDGKKITAEKKVDTYIKNWGQVEIVE